ncbi:Uncharacterized protein OS=Chroococcidiopsis thermalis PCC 7203 GN=Chro_5069 PE=4 SV=1: PMT_2 [Gemmataceae bacterium]|nr:Uncharacterized protein OS=Chroococcidiopsis thermalis PCC 7203 GN=Chro_5069 PE=4 SV=1: PMT_2 [Gemmataceae bacterium]VTU00430.1 Uncharacterized protein OS=Chroococcidiopsis thermalis PCC 7203 GN=Chro_5069 PE=4 SV=1: PMT_2 [Gemmataceae bacterium]
MTPATDGPQLSNRLLPVGSQTVVVAGDSSAAPWSWVASRLLLVALVALGTGLRVVPLAQNRDLWIDEAMLALNLVERTPAGLLEPLAWNQGAPAGFLLATKATISAAGASEWGLRLLPFVASVLGVAGFAWVSRRALAPPAATLALALFAVNPVLTSYAAECKQYAVDAAAAVGLLGVSLGLLRGTSGGWRYAVLAACGAAAVWFSHPAAFVLGGIGTALLADAALARDRRRLLAAAATVGCWLASFAACYALTLRHLGTSRYLLDYWAGHFLPVPPTGPGDAVWLVDHAVDFFVYPGGLGGSEFALGGLAALLGLVGVVELWRRRWPLAVALVLPAALALAASGAQKYPFAGRLLLFLVPLALLAVAEGACRVAACLRAVHPAAGPLLVGVLVLGSALEVAQSFKRPARHEQITEVLGELRARLRTGDRVYLYYGGVPAFTFYTRDNPLPVPVTFGAESRADRAAYRDELRRFAGEPRVWLVFAHRYRDEESLLRAHAEALGECRDEVRRPGAAAYLYDFRAARER